MLSEHAAYSFTANDADDNEFTVFVMANRSTVVTQVQVVRQPGRFTRMVTDGDRPVEFVAPGEFRMLVGRDWVKLTSAHPGAPKQWPPN